MHSCVPGIGAAGVNLAYIKHPVSGFEEKKHFIVVYDRCKETSRSLIKNTFEITFKYDFYLLTLLVVQKPCCPPAKDEIFL